ncbi:hypothetical protein BN59_01853 [Legionella massiliensis]|uniref:Uncharacterized protein n=1 Tax=Legionella massiliensis TaxID=1034943 RepID=A0A078KT06_9GAMM|nr:hypothetical protein [Legionella massiliensis]CDZ77570.1 hypothetical protein BN59_01853 [Legionella massiliensis]CEE13308.1 hypothetical protein BN1094_01853 [Legionella massiliensis]
MRITHGGYISRLKQLKQSYSDLPWYQRWWFSLWSYDLSSALSEIDDENPTTEQVDNLLSKSKEAWFFKSIFGFLDEFIQAVSFFTYTGQTTDIKKRLGNDLEINDLAALASTSRSEVGIFKTILDVSRFLSAVTQCQYQKVGSKLGKDIDLLLLKGRITDNAGYSFSAISGFQYAVWAGNKKMWLKILSCLPKNEHGEVIRLKLLKQYQELKEKGVTYELDGKIMRESQFNFDANMIDVLTTQAGNMYNYNNGTILDNWEKLDQNWNELSNSAKKAMPRHIYDFLKTDYLPLGPMIESVFRHRKANEALSAIQSLDKDFAELELLLNEPIVIDEQHLAAQTSTASMG